MKVTITYHDSESFTSEEIVKLAQTNYGKNITVDVAPDSLLPHDLIIHALQQIITARQLVLLYDRQYTYQEDIRVLRADVLKELAEMVDTVIIDNESKVG